MPSSQEQSSSGQEKPAECLVISNSSNTEALVEGHLSDAPSDDPQLMIQSVDSIDSKEPEKLTFSTLAVEIRLQIYDLLLVSRTSKDENPSWVIGDSDKKLVRLHRMRVQYKTMDVGILQTCRMIYHEAVGILYSMNAFHISESDQFLQFTQQIGPGNVKFLKALHIWVPRLSQIDAWLKVLKILSEEATGIRVLQVGWDAEWEFPWDVDGGEKKGLGDNLDFVRALGQIRGLDRLSIKGFYGKNWPAYLEDKLGLKVRARAGFYMELKEGKLNEDDMKQNKFSSQLNEKQFKLFEKYQAGTKGLFP